MTSTTNAADPASTDSYPARTHTTLSYLERLKELDDEELQARIAEIDSSLSHPVTMIGNATIQGLGPSDLSKFAEKCDMNYVLQQRIEPKTSATKTVCERAGENTEACANLWASNAGQTTTRSTVQ